MCGTGSMDSARIFILVFQNAPDSLFFLNITVALLSLLVDYLVFLFLIMVPYGSIQTTSPLCMPSMRDFLSGSTLLSRAGCLKLLPLHYMSFLVDVLSALLPTVSPSPRDSIYTGADGLHTLITYRLTLDTKSQKNTWNVSVAKKADESFTPSSNAYYKGPMLFYSKNRYTIHS